MTPVSEFISCIYTLGGGGGGGGGVIIKKNFLKRLSLIIKHFPFQYQKSSINVLYLNSKDAFDKYLHGRLCYIYAWTSLLYLGKDAIVRFPHGRFLWGIMDYKPPKNAPWEDRKQIKFIYFWNAPYTITKDKMNNTK